MDAPVSHNQTNAMMPFWWRLRAAYYFVFRARISPRFAWNMACAFTGDDDRDPDHAVDEVLSYWGEGQ